jgi:hypothetical protein
MGVVGDGVPGDAAGVEDGVVPLEAEQGEEALPQVGRVAALVTLNHETTMNVAQ